MNICQRLYSTIKDEIGNMRIYFHTGNCYYETEQPGGII